MTAHIERHNPDGVWKGRTALYNHCVRVTNATTTLYIAGQLARDEHGQTVGVGDIRAQTAKVIENIRTILEDAGSSLEKVVDVTVFLTDIGRDFAAYNRVYAEYFESIRPARTTVGVSGLPGPISVELKVIAEG